MVVLDDHGRARLARVAFARGNGPNLAAPHASPRSEMASMKSWSALERRLLATAIDWRCASAAKPRARTSGTQIWIGRRPCLRSRKRWARTQLRQVRQPTLAPDEQTAQLLLQLLHRTRQRGRTHPAPLGCPREVPPKNSGSDTAPRDPPILTDLPVRCPRPPQRSYSLAYRHRSYAHSGLNQIGPNSTNLEQLRAWSRRVLSNPTSGKSDAIDRRDRGVVSACYAAAIDPYAERMSRT